MLTVRTWDNWEQDLESEYDNDELLNHILVWMQENTVNQQFNLTDATENFAQFEQVKIPLKDDRGINSQMNSALKQGREQGRHDALCELIGKKLEKSMSPEDIAELFELELDEVLELAKEWKKER